MIGTSPQMKAFFHEIERASACDIPVVVCGETGSGKEMAARSIHANSAFAEGPFITVNCADLPTSCVDADLYSRHIGWLSEMFATEPEQNTTADVGTLFLDDVAEMSMPAQASLLRLIDTWSTIRPGTGEPTPIELRVISATNADLYALVKGHRFRSDLYYRLQVLTIQVPSLRERGEDIQALALHFLDEFQQRHPSQVEGFSLAAMRAINQCEWPGNLRELRNRIQQAALYSRDRFIKSADLGLERLDSNRGTVTLQAARDAAERLAITKAIRRNRHNMTRAAEELRVSRMTLYRLVEKHNL